MGMEWNLPSQSIPPSSIKASKNEVRKKHFIYIKKNLIKQLKSFIKLIYNLSLTLVAHLDENYNRYLYNRFWI
jgi:hypothetical protein